MRRIALYAVALAVMASAVFILSTRDASTQATTVDAGNFYFCSAEFEDGVCDTIVVAGSTVTWQISAGIHTVTQCDAAFTTCPPSGGFDSGLLDGGTYAQTFNTPGTVPYYCAFHPNQMRGRIVVQAQATASPVPATPGPGQTAAPSPSGTSVPGATAAPGQVPSSGGPPANGSLLPTLITVLGLGFGLLAGLSVLASGRSRSPRVED